MLPDIPGAEVCRRIRASERSVPQPAIVMLTAKGDEIDRVVGFELGADDYVVKPFSMRELVLRVNAILRARRSPGAAERSGSPTARRRYVVGPLEVDADRYHVLRERRGGARERDGDAPPHLSHGAPRSRALARGSARGRMGLQAGHLDAHRRHRTSSVWRDKAGDQLARSSRRSAAWVIACPPSIHEVVTWATREVNRAGQGRAYADRAHGSVMRVLRGRTFALWALP